jgi:RES domain
VARSRQGSGRHDAPARYGAWYCSRSALSAVAESLQYLRGHTVTDADFRRVGGITKAIVALRLEAGRHVVDLDDPSQLVTRGIRPSQVATLRRSVTQKIAASLFDEGALGLEWWSTLDAEWTNVTLFHERALPHISVLAPPRALSLKLPEVQEAARHLGIRM